MLAQQRGRHTVHKINNHKTNECNEAITITADEPDAKYGNASHIYDLSWLEQDGSGMSVEIAFQRGPIKEVGVNGVTNEALLAVLIHRMTGFQSGEFACSSNQVALDHLAGAMLAFKSRTKRRIEQGVEGTNVVHTESAETD